MSSTRSEIAVALLHYPVLTRSGEVGTTAITSIDIHDFARSCAFYDISPVYLVHPADGMHALIDDMVDYYMSGAGAARNPQRREVLKAIHAVKSIEDIPGLDEYNLWYTSAKPPAGEHVVDPASVSGMGGKQLIVFGTGWGLAAEKMPDANGWLSPIEGIGKVRHLSVRAALAIYLDRLGKR